MALTTSYLTSVKNLDSIINSVVNAKAPDRFTNKFLEDLGFKSSNDRLVIGVFKALGLIDDSGQPLQRYYEMLDQTRTGEVLAVGIQEAYEDLFNLRKDAQNLTNDEIKNKLRTLTQGQKSDDVISKMSSTFRALCDLADWSKSLQHKQTGSIQENVVQTPKIEQEEKVSGGGMNLHYNIQVHLPETTNMAVYDAIFQSLKKHLF